VLDPSMPDLSGLEVARALRASGARKAGFEVFTAKPVLLDQLVNATPSQMGVADAGSAGRAA
jgi:hypothetical protein